MFGIGLPELILIMGIALIVVGPEKLPGLAKGLAKQIVELKKAANLFKESLNDEVGEEISRETDLPMGFSRPEDLAAAGRAALEQHEDELPPSADGKDTPYPEDSPLEEKPVDPGDADPGDKSDG